MPASDSVAKFIARNNAIIDELEGLLETATNQALPRTKRSEALGTAAHKACLALGRLYEAQEQLWEPLQQPHPSGQLDSELVLHLSQPEQYPIPRAPVPPDLFKLFHHPQPGEANNLIREAEQLLGQTVANLPERRDARAELVEQARRSVDKLRAETCRLVKEKVPWQHRIGMVRAAINAVAMASLGAAATEPQQGAWRVAPRVTPDVLHRTAELLQRVDHTLVSLPLLGLLAVAALTPLADAAARSVRASRDDPTEGADSRRPEDRYRARPGRGGKAPYDPRSRARAGRGHRRPDEGDKGRTGREPPHRGGER